MTSLCGVVQSAIQSARRLLKCGCIWASVENDCEGHGCSIQKWLSANIGSISWIHDIYQFVLTQGVFVSCVRPCVDSDFDNLLTSMCVDLRTEYLPFLLIFFSFYLLLFFVSNARFTCTILHWCDKCAIHTGIRSCTVWLHLLVIITSKSKFAMSWILLWHDRTNNYDSQL